MYPESVGTRSTVSHVQFDFAFRLGQDSRKLPAGTYTVYTHEDVYQGSFNPVYLVTSLELTVEEAGRTSSRFIQLADLNAALSRDADRTSPIGEASENPDRMT